MRVLQRFMRGGLCKVLGLCLAAILLRATCARGADAPPAPASLSPEQLKAETERLQKEVKALEESPDAPAEWKELVQIQRKWGELYVDHRKTEEQYRDRLIKLLGATSVQEWREGRDKLYRRLYELQADDRTRAEIAGQKLYEARHRELEKRGPVPTPALHRLGLDVLSYPRMDGSTSTVPLSVLIACRHFDMPCAWVGRLALHNRYYDYEPSWTIRPRNPEPEFNLTEYCAQAKAEKPAQERLATIINRLIVATPSTHDAYVNVIEGRSEIGLLARGPSAAELALAREKGVALATAPCALDALVFLVNGENGLKNLTTEQIRGIYSGKIAQWKDVGGGDAAITPYQREDQSGSQELMRALVMRDLAFVNPEGGPRAPQLILQGMGGPFVALHGDKNGLACSVYYYERYMAGSARTRTIAVDGVEPTDDSLRTRKYPFVSEVLIVTRKGLDPKAPAAVLRDWLLSPEGQAVVRESGYVPLAPK